MKPIADLRLQLLRPGAKRKVQIHISIAAPQPDADDWSCTVRLKGITNGKERRIMGVDSWQALNLALRYVQIHLRLEVREGGQWYYFGGKTSVGSLFAKWGP